MVGLGHSLDGGWLGKQRPTVLALQRVVADGAGSDELVLEPADLTYEVAYFTHAHTIPESLSPLPLDTTGSRRKSIVSSHSLFCCA